LWQLWAATSCRLVYHINVAKSTDGLHTLMALQFCILCYFMFSCIASDSPHVRPASTKPPKFRIVAPLAPAALQTTVHNYCLSTRSVSIPNLTQPGQTVNQPSTPNRKLPICFGTATSLRLFMLNNTSYFQQLRDRIRNKRGLYKTAQCRASRSALPIKYYSGDRIKADWV